ncbi:MAG TPA: DUF4145 domain-containing protein [Bryobacteraceae bacterium]
MFRVFEAAVRTKCEALNAPTKVYSFAAKIDWLAGCGVISSGDVDRWSAIRQLRNEASHPKDQNILPPNEALIIVDIAIDLINSLFV